MAAWVKFELQNLTNPHKCLILTALVLKARTGRGHREALNRLLNDLPIGMGLTATPCGGVDDSA